MVWDEPESVEDMEMVLASENGILAGEYWNLETDPHITISTARYIYDKRGRIKYKGWELLLDTRPEVGVYTAEIYKCGDSKSFDAFTVPVKFVDLCRYFTGYVDGGNAEVFYKEIKNEDNN